MSYILCIRYLISQSKLSCESQSVLLITNVSNIHIHITYIVYIFICKIISISSDQLNLYLITWTRWPIYLDSSLWSCQSTPYIFVVSSSCTFCIGDTGIAPIAFDRMIFLVNVCFKQHPTSAVSCGFYLMFPSLSSLNTGPAAAAWGAWTKALRIILKLWTYFSHC